MNRGGVGLEAKVQPSSLAGSNGSHLSVLPADLYPLERSLILAEIADLSEKAAK